MAKTDLTTVPAVVTIKNVHATDVKAVQFYRTNLTQVLAPGDELEIIVNTSTELFYWIAKRTDELTVAVSE